MLALGGCQPKAAAPSADDEQATVRAVATAHASAIHAALSPQRPGHGITDYPGHAEGDVPKAYAMVLLAEVERLGTAWRAGEANLARTAGQWLLTHADEDGDGVTGWGLPVAWDAYDDGSVNPPHTAYTISTAIVIDALLGWAERDPEAPLAHIRRTVHAAIEPYLDPAIWSPSGLAPYSLAAADRRYDTFNPAAYLAGQMQRASRGVADPRQRERYLASADATMRAVLRHRQLAPGSGHWTWSYSLQQPTLPNDLPHAGYMIEGIRAYIEHGGRLADEFDWYAVLAHLGDFRGTEKDADAVRAFPSFRPRVTLPARAYDLGLALHLACTETRMAHLAPWLVKAVQRYRTSAARYLKYPLGTTAALATAPDLVVNEYEAYLYRGLTSCALAPGARPHAVALAGAPAASLTAPAAAEAASSARSAASPLQRHAARLAGGAATMGAVVPLLPAAAGLVSFDAGERARLLPPPRAAEAAEPLALDIPGVPVRVLAEGGASLVFVRRHPDDRLVLLRYERGRLTCRLPVEHGDDPTAVAALRAAVVHSDRLHAVIYHNPSQANWYVAWELRGACPSAAGPAHKLPSLGEPAGATYEMVPGLHFHAGSTATGAPRLWLAGGNVQMEVGAEGLHAIEQVSGCRHVVESTATPLGLAHLCIAATAGAGADAAAAADVNVNAMIAARAPLIVAPAGLGAPAIDPARGVPWRLRYSLGALQIDHAASPRQLRHLLRSDLARTAPGGWAEVGINNEEGRIPWSQVYYLNGYLDLLDVAGRDTRALDLYGPLLAEVRQRLDLEMRLLDRQVAAGRHHTRAFTVDRSRALFGVQTGRLLLVMHRYRTEVAGALPMTSYESLRRAVQRLEGHIEVLATAGEEARWLQPGRHHLRWPKGSKFAFDGMAVPFNHQNEWAYAVLATAGTDTPAPVLEAATDVLGHFVQRIAPAGALPASGSWDYWWGQAYDGWRPQDERSVNMPSYRGDRIKAWISFRTIDAMSLLAGGARLGDAEAANTQRSATELARRGLLYPLAHHALADRRAFLSLAPAVAQEYARTSAPWELGNSAWSLAALAAHWQPPISASPAPPAAGR
jgi:hypothetical protein